MQLTVASLTLYSNGEVIFRIDTIKTYIDTVSSQCKKNIFKASTQTNTTNIFIASKTLYDILIS